MTPRRRRQKRPAEQGRPNARITFGASVASVRPLEWATLAVTAAATVWAWLTYVVEPPQDFDSFFVVFVIAAVGGGTLQVALMAYMRPSGSLRQRLAFGARAGAQGGAWIPLLAPAVIIGLALLVLTPPSTPVGDFDSDMNLYQVIPLIALLALAGTAIGAGAVFLLIVMPLGFLVAALLPRDQREIAPSKSLQLTRSQLVLAAIFLFSVVGFAASMASVNPDARGSRPERMWETLVALFAATGDPTASALAWCFALAVALIVIVSNRVEARLRRQRPVRSQDPDPAESPDPGEDVTH